MTLTVAVEHRANAWQFLERYIAKLEKNLLPGGSILALDKPNGSEHVHFHGVVLAPSRISSDRLIRWWRKLFVTAPPVSKAQMANPLPLPRLPSALSAALGRTLQHALGCDRKSGVLVELPPLRERVLASGKLLQHWKAVACARGLMPHSNASGHSENHAAGLPLPGDYKPSTTPPRRVAKACCPWCLTPLPKEGRCDRRYCCDSCQSAANRAVRGEERKLGRCFDRDELALLLDCEWTVRDSLRSLMARETGKTVVLKRQECRCQKPLANQMMAKTCGRSACRRFIARHDTQRWMVAVGLAIKAEHDWFTVRQLKQAHRKIPLVESCLLQAVLEWCDEGLVEKDEYSFIEVREFRLAERYRSQAKR